jgi:hypothetical protein
MESVLKNMLGETIILLNKIISIKYINVFVVASMIGESIVL